MTEISQRVRVRFAPSPTGGLHLGGVRTVLFNYLFARRFGGDFVLRIEDTDQARYVPGAEEYILECLAWCGLEADEGPHKGGPYGPYRQSERRKLYLRYAEELVDKGYAYYAFDTPEELEAMREQLRAQGNHSPQYNHEVRTRMRNSITLPPAVVQELLEKGTPHVIRICMPPDETVSFNDMIRGAVSFQTGLVDDKVLLKADGLPTYHLAVVVDDYLMKITHAFRGEEWLPSAPVHLLLWKYLGWESSMPQWAHLPLILRPDGNGKLSKRDGARLGFPVYAMNWRDPATGELTEGFRERGFLPEAFVNMLALLGWNDGTDREVFSLEELIAAFSLERVNKAGAKFDFEKAKWFNHQYIMHMANADLAPLVRPFIAARGYSPSQEFLETFCGLMKERATLLTEFWEKGSYLFEPVASYDRENVLKRWNAERRVLFDQLAARLATLAPDATTLEAGAKDFMQANGLKPGEVLPLLRIALTGSMQGPGVFDMMALLGSTPASQRLNAAFDAFDDIVKNIS